MEALAGLVALATAWWMLLWVVCGIVCAVAAESRGRSGGAFFALGIIFGPVGLLMLIAFAPLPTKAAKWRMDANNERQCPVCREIVRIDAHRCKFCTSQITPPKPEEIPPAPTVPVPRQVRPPPA